MHPKNSYTPEKIIEDAGGNLVENRSIFSEEIFTYPEALNFCQSLAPFSCLNQEEKEKILFSLPDFLEPFMSQGILSRAIRTSVLIAQRAIF